LEILIVTAYYKPAHIYGGPIISISELCQALVHQRIKITVLTTNANGKTILPIPINTPLSIEGINITYHSLSLGERGFFSLSLLKNLYKTLKIFDAIHIHGWWNLTTILSVFLCYLKGVTPVLSTRGMLSIFSFGNRQSLFKKIFHITVGKFLLSKTVLHATSQKEVEECLKIIPHWKYFYAPNFIDFPIKKDCRLKKIDDFKLNIIFLSRIHPVKGLDFLFEALSKIAFPWSLLLVGKGDNSYVNILKEQAQRLGISLSIIWKEWADSNEKYDLLEAADLMVLTSHTENFANTILESLSMGTPVLVSNRVGLCDYVEKNDFGWVVDLDSNAISKALQQAFRQKEKRERIRHEAPEKIRQDFAPKKIVQQYITMYQKIINKEI
jgi:glycosyltransferase involved in cell wall biosynthesis